MKWLFGSEVIVVLPNRYHNLGIRGNILEKWNRERAFNALQILEREGIKELKILEREESRKRYNVKER